MILEGGAVGRKSLLREDRNILALKARKEVESAFSGFLWGMGMCRLGFGFFFGGFLGIAGFVEGFGREGDMVWSFSARC